MRNDNFNYKSFCQLAIISDYISPELITRDLLINPTKYYIKGEKSISKKSGSVIVKSQNQWFLISETLKLDNESINGHIDFFKLIFSEKMEVIKRYKDNKDCELIFTIWIETDDAGIGFDLNEEQIAFINNISNRVHFTLLTQ